MSDDTAKIHVRSLLEGNMIATAAYYELEGTQQRLYQRIFDTEEAQIKEKLMQLGWLPPEHATTAIKLIEELAGPGNGTQTGMVFWQSAAASFLQLIKGLRR